MKMKNFKILAAALLAVPFANAQSMAEAMKKTDNERYDAASSDFQKLIAAEPANAKLYFYYGENLFEQGQTEKAKEQWDKGLGINPKDELNMIGAGKYLWYKGDTTAARTSFNNALAATKNKNAEVMRQIAEVLIEAPKKDAKGAVVLLDKAIKLDPKNIDNFLLKGDALQIVSPRDGSPAIQAYNEGTYINPTDARILVRKGDLYSRIQNTALAEEQYRKAIAADATFAPAYRMLAELKLAANSPSEGVKNYEKYLELNDSRDARFRYAAALYYSQNYCDMIPQVQKVEQMGLSDLYTKRMLSIGTFECAAKGDKSAAKYQEALNMSNEFFKMADPKLIVGGDYGNRGKIYQALGNDSLAILEMEKAIAIDTAYASPLYSELIALYGKKNNYGRIAQTYSRKVKGDLSKLNTTENYEMGRALYFEGKDYAMADSAFARLNRQAPTYAVGYVWRGRTSFKLEDPKNIKYLAFPAYSKYFEVIKPEERSNAAYNSYTMEAARYLGDYYVNGPEKNKEKAKEYWGIVRSIEPNDPQAKAFFNSPMGK
jgi:tetratricopeptide (TPR) repeat protein